LFCAKLYPDPAYFVFLLTVDADDDDDDDDIFSVIGLWCCYSSAI